MIYSNTNYPVKERDLKNVEEDFSVDVITFTPSGMLNIGYWNYDMKMWIFHTDTLTDPYEGGKLQDFNWMYPPVELTQSFEM